MAAKTIDDLYNLLERYLEKVNSTASGGGGGSSKFDFEDIINNLGRLNKGLTEYNTTFEKEILKGQQDNLKEIERHNKELEKLHKEQEDSLEAHRKSEETEYKRIAAQRAQAETDLANATTEAAKKAARDNIEKADKAKADKDKEYYDTTEAKKRDRKIQDRENAINRKQDEIVSSEEDRRTFQNSRIGRNTTQYANKIDSMAKNGKMMQSLGESVGGGFGKAISSAGGKLSSFAGALGKAVPVIGWVITGLQLLGDAAKAVAEADAELQDIQNERNTAMTNRNIERSKLDTASLIDRLETATANGLATFEVESSYAIGKQNIANMTATAVAQNATNAITNGYNSAAWEALNASMDIEAERQRNELRYGEGEGDNKGVARAKMERANALRDLELSGREKVREIDAKLVDQDLREKQTELDIWDAKYSMEHPFATTATRIAGSSTDADIVYNPSGKKYEDVEGTFEVSTGAATAMGVANSLDILGITDSFTGAYITKMETVAKQQNVNARNQLNATKAQTENVTSMQNSIMSSTNQLTDAFTDTGLTVKEALIDTDLSINKTYAQFSQKIEEWTLKFEKLSLDSAAGKGFTTSTQNTVYSKFMNETVQVLSRWGLNEQDTIAMQNAYGQGTGRSVMGNTADLNKTAAMGKYLGDNNLAVELSNSTEIFNMGMSTTMDLMWDMTKKVNKMGLDGRKYMKDMTKNLQMAQKYNFKGGVQGMMNMAKWAQNVRYDLNKLPALLEDMFSGGLEGAITKAAKLQVLGGQFAMGADPLAMMYEAMEDPAALAERINNMTTGMGRFNSKTGQVEFNGMEQRQLQLLAEYTGQSLEDVKNQASYKMKNEQMGHFINNGLDDDQRASLVNKAYLKDGKWMVNGINGQAMDVRSITSNNINQVQADTHEGFVEQALQEIVGWQDKEFGLTTEQQAAISQALVDAGDYFRNQEERYQTQLTENSKIDEWRTRVAGYWAEATAKFEAFKKDVTDPQAAMQEALNTIADKMGPIEESVASIVREMEDSIDASNASSDPKYIEALKWYSDTGNKNGDMDAEIRTLQSKLNQYRNGTITIDKLRDYLTDGWDDWGDALKAGGVNTSDSGSYITADQVQQLIDTYNKEFKDGVVSSNNHPMSISASDVTPIHDGTIARTDPRDHGLFAKTGGPFDTLFNGIFAKINEISSVLPRAMEYIMPLAGMTQGFTSNYKDTANNGNIKIETVKIELSGSLELTSNGGQSINIIDEIRNNPVLLRSLTQLISEGINKNINGGKSTYTGGLTSPRFNTIGY